MKKILIKIVYLFVFILVVLSFKTEKVFASSVVINSSKDSVGIDEEFYVDVFLDTEGEIVNGVEGSIKFNEEELSLVRIEDGKSVIGLWIEKPKTIDTNTIRFSGIIPNGFDGVIDPFNTKDKFPGLIIRLIFKGVKPGLSSVSASTFDVTLNDGQGTIINTLGVNKNITILDVRNPFVYKNLSDVNPQLDFEIIRDPNIYENKYVLIFQSRDKETGIEKVMIKEGKRDWAVIESPYLLKDQSRHSNISILATNYSGTSIVKNIDPLPREAVSTFTIVVLTLVIILIFFILRKIYAKRYKKYTVTSFLILVFSLIFSFASAANVTLTVPSLNYKVGDTIQIRVQLKSDVSVNAISSKIFYSKDIVSLSSISKYGSIVSLWAQEPNFSNTLGSANLEGVILSGYTGNNGNIVTLVFKANKEGQAEVKLSDVSVLANDGNGTNVFSGSLSSLYINIDKSTPSPKIETTTTNTPVKEKTKMVEKIEESKDKVIAVTEVAVEKVGEVEVTNSLPKYSLLITIIILLLIILIFVIIFAFILLMKLKKYFTNKLIKTEIIIDKNFNDLEKDINQKIEHNSKESGKIIKEEILISDEISKTKNEIIKEVIAVEKEL